MNRLRANSMIFWLLMLCIGVQGIGSAVHRIGHGSHSLGYAKHDGQSGHSGQSEYSAHPGASPLAASTEQGLDEFGLVVVEGKSDKAANHGTELCLVCANLSAAKSLNPFVCWLADTNVCQHHRASNPVREIDRERQLFALARAPPAHLS